MSLHGARIVVAGAGLAGLAAARALEARGATVTTVEARDRVGGRVWTWRDGFAGRQHAEAGADLIDGDQHAILELSEALGLHPVPILRGGIGYYGEGGRWRASIDDDEEDGGPDAVGPLMARIAEMGDEYRLVEQRWDSPIVRRLARVSVADWLKAQGASEAARARFRAFRGLFLADPEALSLLALVDFFATEGPPGPGRLFRLQEGNDRLASAMAAALRTPPQLETVLRRLRQTDTQVVLTVEHASGRHELTADAVVLALPATAARAVLIEPALPVLQQHAINHLKYGPATRLVLQFADRFWAQPGRPGLFASDQPTGAVWDGNEQTGPGPAMLSLLAGGGASADLQELLAREGPPGVVDRLRWMGQPAELLAWRAVAWEDDPFARGGYAYFDPGFNPIWRDWLARPCGRLFFAGEHTSIRWQGYMNGALESGERAAAEIAAWRAAQSPEFGSG